MKEVPIYGSSGLGHYTGGGEQSSLYLGRRRYEISNHLGNVLTTITDELKVDDQGNREVVIASTSDYYPFGMQMPGRDISNSSYRYGFNGKEKDDKGEFGNTVYDYGFRIYNPQIGKFLSVDPLTVSYPELTPYQYASNKPINSIDLDGLEARTSIKGEMVEGKWVHGSDNYISISHAVELQDKANRAAWQKIINYKGVIRNNDITSTARYKMFKFNVETYGDFVLPLDVSKRLINGEEVAAWEIGVEIAGFIPIAKPLKYLDETIEVLAKVVKNSKGDDVIRTFVKNEDDLLKVANDLAGGDLDKLDDLSEVGKPGWYEGIIDGKKARIEYQISGEASVNHGPHVKLQFWNPDKLKYYTKGPNKGKLKSKKGGWDTVEKYYIEGQENYKQ